MSTVPLPTLDRDTRTRSLPTLCFERNLHVDVCEGGAPDETHLRTILREYTEREERSVRSERESGVYVRDAYESLVHDDWHCVLRTRGGEFVTVGDGELSSLKVSSGDDGSDSDSDSDSDSGGPAVVRLCAGENEHRWSVSVGTCCTFFVSRQDGSVYACGMNSQRLFFGLTPSDGVPDLIPATRPLCIYTPSSPILSHQRVKQVAAGSSHSLILVESGVCFSCGDSDSGGCGQGRIGADEGDSRNPHCLPLARVVFEGPIDRVVAASEVSGFIVRDASTHTETLYTCGFNYYGALGVGDRDHRYTPTRVVALPSSTDRLVQVHMSYDRLFVWTRSVITAEHERESLYVCGESPNGELGLPSSPQPTSFFTMSTIVCTPTAVVLETMLADRERLACVSLGGYHSMFLTDRGSLFGSGWNRNGQLHELDGTESKQLGFRPLNVAEILHDCAQPSTSRVVGLACMRETTVLLLDTGRCVTFGDNSAGERGLSKTTDKSVLSSPTLLPSLYRVAEWHRSSTQLSSYPLQFRLALRYAVLAWSRAPPSTHTRPVSVWRRGGVGFMPLTILVRVFELASLPIDAWLGSDESASVDSLCAYYFE